MSILTSLTFFPKVFATFLSLVKEKPARLIGAVPLALPKNLLSKFSKSASVP
jgi:hypothetical protein